MPISNVKCNFEIDTHVAAIVKRIHELTQLKDELECSERAELAIYTVGVGKAGSSSSGMFVVCAPSAAHAGSYVKTFDDVFLIENTELYEEDEWGVLHETVNVRSDYEFVDGDLILISWG